MAGGIGDRVRRTGVGDRCRLLTGVWVSVGMMQADVDVADVVRIEWLLALLGWLWGWYVMALGSYAMHAG